MPRKAASAIGVFVFCKTDVFARRFFDFLGDVRNGMTVARDPKQFCRRFLVEENSWLRIPDVFSRWCVYICTTRELVANSKR